MRIRNIKNHIWGNTGEVNLNRSDSFIGTRYGYGIASGFGSMRGGDERKNLVLA